jgi:hypothetical protein
MSVPLDRLYNFLHDLSNHAIIIYGFKPYGSKKLSDLKFLQTDTIPPWFYGQTTPAIIFHDQEPLQFDLYSEDSIAALAFERFNQQAHPEMLAQLSQMHIRGVTWTPYSGYDLMMLCHSEKNSPEVEKYQAAGFVPVYYWSHALIARDWFRFAEYDPILDNKNITKDFLIYNRAWSGTREYRLKFAELLCVNELETYCKTSFNPVDSDIHYQDYKYQNVNFKISTALESRLSLNTHSSAASADYNHDDYASAGIEVVLETLFDDQRNHLTEKILRPIACGVPFITLATPGTLVYLKNYGFKTFSPIINEDYDQELDSLKRMQMIIAEMNRIAKLDRADKTLLWEKLYEIADYNKKWFFSSSFHDMVVEEYQHNFHEAIDTMNQNRTGMWYKQLGEIASLNPEMGKYYNNVKPGRTQQDIDNFYKWINQNP